MSSPFALQALVFVHWEGRPILLLGCVGGTTLALVSARWERPLVLVVLIILQVLLLMLDIENKLATIGVLESVFFLNAHSKQLF